MYIGVNRVSMGDSLLKADITKKMMQHLLDRLKELYMPRSWPIIDFNAIPSGISVLIDEILETGHISEDLQIRIGKILGKRWLRRRK